MVKMLWPCVSPCNQVKETQQRFTCIRLLKLEALHSDALIPLGRSFPRPQINRRRDESLSPRKKHSHARGDTSSPSSRLRLPPIIQIYITKTIGKCRLPAFPLLLYYVYVRTEHRKIWKNSPTSSSPNIMIMISNILLRRMRRKVDFHRLFNGVLLLHYSRNVLAPIGLHRRDKLKQNMENGLSLSLLTTLVSSLVI